MAAIGPDDGGSWGMSTLFGGRSSRRLGRSLALGLVWGIGGVAAVAQTEVSTTGAGRLDDIRAAVSEALEATPSAREGAVPSTVVDQPPDPSPADTRRERLEALVVTTPVPARVQGDTYVDELRKEVSSTLVQGDAQPGATDAGPAPVAAAASVSQPRDYRVQPGDSLWKIAQSLLGDGNRWPVIYALNRDSLKNVDVLRVGQVLRMPES